MKFKQKHEWETFKYVKILYTNIGFCNYAHIFGYEYKEISKLPKEINPRIYLDKIKNLKVQNALNLVLSPNKEKEKEKKVEKKRTNKRKKKKIRKLLKKELLMIKAMKIKIKMTKNYIAKYLELIKELFLKEQSHQTKK